ncbi:MAG TPA: hypothetical protein VFI61_03075 [Patescibacteria group bacterium]|nr:hypothetical protein [Patescibacteria group bacterium]
MDNKSWKIWGIATIIAVCAGFFTHYALSVYMQMEDQLAFVVGIVAFLIVFVIGAVCIIINNLLISIYLAERSEESM